MPYVKNGLICDHFDQSRHDKYDKFGRSVATDFLQSKGFEVSNGEGKGGWADLLAVMKSRELCLRFEAEVKHGKSGKAWQYALNGGIDVPARKAKYKDMDFHVMVKSDGKEILITARKYWDYALEGEEVRSVDEKLKDDEREMVLRQGQEDCKIIRKRFWHSGHQCQVVGDFIRVNAKNAMWYRKTSKGWEKVNDR